ncbi:dipeptidase PepE [Aliiglaciecola litoralis]
MSDKRILMLSSSRSHDEDYLEGAKHRILPFLDDIKSVLFVPYAGVTMSWDEYTDKVQQALPALNVTGIHTFADPIEAVQSADAILVGGGNTFNLLYQLQVQQILPAIQDVVQRGCPYIGWSAGSNICGLSIKTTNDMPIIEPQSFAAMGFLPIQLNPHYSDYQPPGHNGETRAQRITEFCVLNPTTPVVGIREGSALLYQNGILSLIGEHKAVVFLGKTVTEISKDDDLANLLTQQN